MVIANVEYVCSYNSVFDFVEKNLKEVKKVFKEELKNLEIEEEQSEAEAIAEHLIDEGICDEDVIREVLARDKKKWFIQYVDDGNFGYFDIYEVKE